MTDRPEISLFLPYLDGRGANRVLLLLANGFAGAGRRVDLVLASAKGPLLADVDPRVRVVDLRSRGGVLRAVPAWARYLVRTRPLALLTALDYVNQLAVVLRGLCAPASRLVVSCHNAPRESARQAARWHDRHLAPITSRLLYPRADRIVCVSAGLADSLAAFSRLPRERLDVVYNPVVTDAFDTLAAAPVDHPWTADAPARPRLVLATGALAPQKGFATLLRAFARLPEAPAARLVILGEGPDRPALERLAAELGLSSRVAFPGFVPNPYAWMSRADVFVLSSRWEGFGLVLAEALAAGCPVVSTDCPSGPSEILDRGRFGRLVPVGDADAMAEAILRTLAEPFDRDMLRRRGCEFSVDRAVDAYLRLLGFPPGGTVAGRES